QPPSPVPVCFAYDKDGARAEKCVDLAGTTQVGLDGVGCPRWWLVPAGSPPLYQNTWSSEQVDAAFKGWPSLTTLEQRRVFEQLVDPPAIVAALPTLLASNDTQAIADAARSLLELDRLIPEEIHARIDAWILKTIGSRSGTVKLDKAGADERAIIELLALAGDQPSRAEAIALVARRNQI